MAKTQSKNYIVYIIVALIAFVLGFVLQKFTPGIIGGVVAGTSLGKLKLDCEKFCNTLPNTEYGYVDERGNCFCYQEQVNYDFQRDKTIKWKLALNAGIIKDVKIENSIDPAIKQQAQVLAQQRQQMLAQQQQILQQQPQTQQPQAQQQTQ